MVAPSLTLADSHSKHGEVHSSDYISLTPAPEKHDHGATCFVTPALIDSSSEEGRHESNCCNGDIKCPINHNHGSRVIKESQSNVEECGIHTIKEGEEPESNDHKLDPWENNAMCQEGATKITSRDHETCPAQQPIAYASVNAGCISKGKRVQWSDNHGKELVHVYEYGVSDTGESEEDEEDTYTCSCTIQ